MRRRAFARALLAGAAGLGLLAPGALALSPGALDPSFGTNGTVQHQFGAGASPSSEAWAVAAQPDGKVVIAGQASDSNGRLEVLAARLNSDGSLDQSFGSGGVVVDQLGAGATPRSGAEAVAIQPDGKIIVAGDASDAAGNNEVMTARLDADGSLDSSFGTGGVVLSQLGVGIHPSSQVNFDAILLEGNKVVLGGEATDSHNESQFMVIRLNSDGSFDSSFGSGGVVLHQYGLPSNPRSRATSLALQSDGQILAGGNADDASATGQQEFLLVRLNATDGSPDSSFGTGGAVATQLGSGPNPGSHVFAVRQENDGKLVVGGDATDSGGNGLAMIARLNANGSFDTSFGSGGVVSNQFGRTSAFGTYSQVFNLLLEPNGKLVTGLYASGDSVNLAYGSQIARFNSDGSLDSSFGSGGPVDPVPLPVSATSWADQDGLAFQPDGQILASGDDSIGGGQAWVTRLIGDPSPTASVTTSPNTVAAGAPVSFTGSVLTDPHGSIPSYRWSFGDGTTTTGSSPHHTYATAGTYTATLTVIYDDGVRTSASETVTVLGAPQLSHVSESHRRWREGTALPHIARAKRPPVGTTFRFTTNETVKLRLAFTQRHHGHRVTRGTLSASLKAGANKLRFQGRISRHKRLKAGRYTLIITVTNAVGQRATKKLQFTIVKG
jgi:uncharacterized delta-60 repeat protein